MTSFEIACGALALVSFVWVCINKAKLNYYIKLSFSAKKLINHLQFENMNLKKCAKPEALSNEEKLLVSIFSGEEPQFNGISYEELEYYISNTKKELVSKGLDTTGLEMLSSQILDKPFNEM